MKKVIPFLALCLIAVVITGCATPYPMGSLYTELKLPVAVTANKGEATKVGTAECTSILAMLTTGDVSIEAAMKNGGITEVMYIDWEVKNIAGIIGKYKIIVHGK